MAASGASARPPRRGPAPIASFDHSFDVSDESSPESKQAFRLPEIREDPGARTTPGESLAPAEGRARSHSSPGAALGPPAAPRIDISRASSSSHHDSRDSSPELALFSGGSGGDRARLELGFREDGALDLRSSTEELAFLEPAPGEAGAPPTARPAVPPPPPAPPERRHSRKDSQSSEVALLAVSGRTSRLSSVGSQCSAQSALSALSRVSRLSVVSGTSRSPSPHRMLLETSFCGPKPIETDPEISAGALVEQILGISKISGTEAAATPAAIPASSPPAPVGVPPPAPIDARDRREVRTEVTVESARLEPAPPAPATFAAASPASPEAPSPAPVHIEKNEKETKNHTQTEVRKARPRIRREPSEPEVYKTRNKSKDIIIIKLKPDDSYEEEEERERAGASAAETARKPATLELGRPARPAEAPPSPALSRRRSPSPAGPPVSRKSSFCSLFKSRETIASPESPSEALRRKRSLTEGRSRSKSRDRSATPISASKIRGSVLSLFRTPRRSAVSPSAGSREGSPVVQPARSPASAPLADRHRADKLKYYEDTKDGIIHIPLRTPPDDRGGSCPARRSSGGTEPAAVEAPAPRPASAPQPRAVLDHSTLVPDPPAPSHTEPPPTPPDSQLRTKREPRPSSSSRVPPIHRTVLPDGSIIIPLHSPTERIPEIEIIRVEEPVSTRVEGTKATTVRTETSPGTATPTRGWAQAGAPVASAPLERSIDERFSASSSTPGRVEPHAHSEDTRRRRKERLVFSTQVGSREQVFSTQFSITKTPSVTSEISGSFPSFTEGEEARLVPAPLRDSHIAAEPAEPRADAGSGAATPQDAPRDSSESEPSSEAPAPLPHAGNDVEKRGLVVQESFEDELPYVPTTLPQERSMALPMVPVRERGGVHVSGVQRPRAGAPPTALVPATAPAAAPAPPDNAADKLRIKLPRRPRPSPATDRPPTRSGGDSGAESRSKTEWIDFEEVPERRKQPKRIQTLPAGAGAGGGLVFSYVEPEHCRCECHGHTRADDQLPLLRDDIATCRISSSSAECSEEAHSSVEPSVPTARLPAESGLSTAVGPH